MVFLFLSHKSLPQQKPRMVLEELEGCFRELASTEGSSFVFPSLADFNFVQRDTLMAFVNPLNDAVETPEDSHGTFEAVQQIHEVLEGSILSQGRSAEQIHLATRLSATITILIIAKAWSVAIPSSTEGSSLEGYEDFDLIDEATLNDFVAQSQILQRSPDALSRVIAIMVRRFDALLERLREIDALTVGQNQTRSGLPPTNVAFAEARSLNSNPAQDDSDREDTDDSDELGEAPQEIQDVMKQTCKSFFILFIKASAKSTS